MSFRNLLILLYLFSSELHAACQECSKAKHSCRDAFYQNLPILDSSLIHLEKESFQKLEVLQQSKEFQDIVSGLQSGMLNTKNAVHSASTAAGGISRESFKPSFYLFVSFSLGEEALFNLAHEAKQFGVTLVLRGFREGSYRKTAQAFQKIITKTGQGVIIDPELFSLFSITAIPTFVLSKSFHLHSRIRIQTPIHDKLQGHVSVHYALETFIKEGKLKEEANSLLNSGGKQ